MHQLKVNNSAVKIHKIWALNVFYEEGNAFNVSDVNISFTRKLRRALFKVWIPVEFEE